MTIIDTTEHVEPFPTGYTDPFDQILSDEETAPLEWETHPPRPRIWAEREVNTDGYRPWHLRMPSGFNGVYDSHADALEALSYLTATTTPKKAS